MNFNLRPQQSLLFQQPRLSPNRYIAPITRQSQSVEDSFFIKVNKAKVEVSKQVFLQLLDFAPIIDSAPFQKSIETNEISFSELKQLAEKAGVPYPFFFAPYSVVQKQYLEKSKQLSNKIPTKNEMQLTGRGKLEIKEIQLIIEDIGRKQEFLKSRILPSAPENQFVGCQAKNLKNQISYSVIATNIREYFAIDLSLIRTIPKTKVLSYLCSCIEKEGILVSFSSYNYMPQNISPNAHLSGICIKDKKFPFIFINTRDGDEKPKILETEGRQIFTLLSMLVCIAIGKFVLSSKTGKSVSDPSKIAFAIAGEIMIPTEDLGNIDITDLEDLRKLAHYFRVTPSMLLCRLRESKKIDTQLANKLQFQLREAVKKAQTTKRNPPLAVNAYGKYNGNRFSKEVIKAFKSGRITHIDVKNILFRKGKRMDNILFQDYNQKFG